MADRRCARCILSEHFPGVTFDDQGVCNFCNDEIIDKTTDSTIEDTKRDVRRMLAEKSGKSEYDAVLCYSGGKDSTYTLKVAVEKYKLKVLAFTLDNGFISPTALANIKLVVEALGVDHIFFKPARNVYASIIRTSLTRRLYPRATARRISAGCQSCISIVNNMALKFALEKNIPFVLAGFTLGQIPANGIIYQNNYEFLLESRKKSLDILRAEGGDDILPYLTIGERTLSRVESYPYTLNLLCLEDISETEIVQEIAKIGWVTPKDVDGCSSNCTLNALNNYVHLKEYRFNPYELELSQLVRRGQLSREEAIKKVEDQSLDQVRQAMASLGLTEEDFKTLGAV